MTQQYTNIYRNSADYQTAEENSAITPSTAAEPKTKRRKGSLPIFNLKISMGRAMAFLFGGLFFYFECRIWELQYATFWSWTKEQAVLWLGLLIGVLILLGVLIGFKGLQKWTASPRNVVLAVIALFVIYQAIISIPHISVVGDWLVDPYLLPSPFTGWLISFLSILAAYVHLPKRRKK